MKKNFSPEYLAYMKSPQWRAVRGRVLQRDSCRCRDCGLVSARNDVHHLTYARLGSESLDDLVTLCRSCHDIRHGAVKRKKVKKPRTFLERMALVNPSRYGKKRGATRAKKS